MASRWSNILRKTGYPNLRLEAASWRSSIRRDIPDKLEVGSSIGIPLLIATLWLGVSRNGAINNAPSQESEILQAHHRFIFSPLSPSPFALRNKNTGCSSRSRVPSSQSGPAPTCNASPHSDHGSSISTPAWRLPLFRLAT